jgi:DNA mismatch endonuclease (patch repair protein)
LRKALWRLGVRYRIGAADLPGKPDIVIKRANLVVFVDGDFWHGRDLEGRLAKLEAGHNPGYWVEKLRRNVERDRRNDEALRTRGWRVLRIWETDVLKDPDRAAGQVIDALIQVAPGSAAMSPSWRKDR